MDDNVDVEPGGQSLKLVQPPERGFIAEPQDGPTSLSMWAMSALLGRIGADEEGDETHILRGLE